MGVPIPDEHQSSVLIRASKCGLQPLGPEAIQPDKGVEPTPRPTPGKDMPEETVSRRVCGDHSPSNDMSERDFAPAGVEMRTCKSFGSPKNMHAVGKGAEVVEPEIIVNGRHDYEASHGQSG